MPRSTFAPLPADSAAHPNYATCHALLVGDEHDRPSSENRESGPEALLTAFRGCGAPLLLLARGGNEMTAVDAMRAGAADYIPVRLVSPALIREANEARILRAAEAQEGVRTRKTASA